MHYLICLFFLCSCSSYYLSINKEKLGKDDLASTYVKSPDPRQDNPPTGDELIINWKIPRNALLGNPSMLLEILYKDFKIRKKILPVKYKRGTHVIRLEDDVISYRAFIRNQKGEVIQSWQQQLWCDPIPPM